MVDRACGVGTVALVATAWWLRVRAIRKRYVLVFNERALVSREIHDTLLQSLAAIGVELETVLRQLDPRETAAVNTLHRLQRQTKHSLKEARDLVVALRRTQLSKAPGLIETVRDIADHTTAARATNVTLSVEGGETLFRRRRAELIRVCQEAINNAIAHGAATDIQIVFEFRGADVALRVVRQRLRLRRRLRCRDGDWRGASRPARHAGARGAHPRPAVDHEHAGIRHGRRGDGPC